MVMDPGVGLSSPGQVSYTSVFTATDGSGQGKYKQSIKSDYRNSLSSYQVRLPCCRDRVVACYITNYNPR